MQKNYGTLFLVGTPIGNLQDITFRAIETLKKVDFIACEDTRRTKILLKHYNISSSLFSYHKYNKEKAISKILSLIKDGKDIAVVSDAGMPGISDEGSELVSIALQNNIKVEVIPGVAAFLCALVLSGISTSRFHFLGFLPKKKGQRQNFLTKLKNYPDTLIFYEAKTRIIEALKDIKEIFGKRHVAVAKELTKIYQEVYRGNIEDVINVLKDKKLLGEWVIVVDGNKDKETKSIDILNNLEMLIKQGYAKKEAISLLCKEYNLKKNDVYKASLKIV